MLHNKLTYKITDASYLQEKDWILGSCYFTNDEMPKGLDKGTTCFSPKKHIKKKYYFYGLPPFSWGIMNTQIHMVAQKK